MRTRPDTDSRSSQAGSRSDTPTEREPEALRRSTEPLVEVISMSPDPDLASTSVWNTEPIVTSPDPDLARTGQWTSPTLTAPDPDSSRAPDPATEPTVMLPAPVEQSRPVVRPTLISPEPLAILERPMSGSTDTTDEPVLITYSRQGGAPSRRWAAVARH